MSEKEIAGESTPENDSKTFDGGVTREELHVRQIEFRGFRRSDGLFEIESQLADRKTHDFTPPSGGRSVAAGAAIHDLALRVVFDDAMIIRAIHTSIRAYPYAQCVRGGESLQALVGLRIGPGWSSELRKRLPPGDTCTHLKEVMVPLASAAFQTVYSVSTLRVTEVDASGKPRKIDSCYAYGASRELVRIHWPSFHRPE